MPKAKIKTPLVGAAIGAEALPTLDSLVQVLETLRQPGQIKPNRCRALTQLVLRFAPQLAAEAAQEPSVRAALLPRSVDARRHPAARREPPRGRSEGV